MSSNHVLTHLLRKSGQLDLNKLDENIINYLKRRTFVPEYPWIYPLVKNGRWVFRQKFLWSEVSFRGKIPKNKVFSPKSVFRQKVSFVIKDVFLKKGVFFCQNVPFVKKGVLCQKGVFRQKRGFSSKILFVFTKKLLIRNCVGR